MPVIIESLEHLSTETREVAAFGLSVVIGAVRRAIERARANGDIAGERKAIKALREIGDSSIPALIRLLADPDEEVRELAARILGYDIGVPALPALFEALRSENSRRRFHAISALDYPGAEAGAAIPALIERLKDEDGRVAWMAARILGKMRAEAATSALIASLRGTTFRLRLESVHALMKLTSPMDEARPILTQALQEEGRGWRFRIPAAILLQRLDGDARVIIPSLIEAFGIGKPHFEEAAAALLSIGQEAVPSLLELLKNERAEVRRRAVIVLEKLGVSGQVMIPELIELLKRKAGLLQK